jgi:hypothetical protein
MKNERDEGMTFDLEHEVWKPIAGFADRYEVSSWGRVRSRARGTPRILRPGPSNCGHLSVSLGRRNTRMVHQLVTTTFIGPRPPGEEVRHLDGDPANNRLTNLCWGTRSDNIRDAVAHGTWESPARAAGRKSPDSLRKLAKARAVQSRADVLSALARGRRTRWGAPHE